ncbi:MAG: hypothetical protein H7641_15035, partial [Candidatus Heimdallarchaeota archaeon]|nr:hypothetical protein [Candidatus Heimdallarchaeota archaeon]MCK4878878.1 hypothetical protein [Candidatus Heimdallarchaeota archaeon]
DGMDYYAARGRHGQMIYVVPEHDIVAVITANFTPYEGGYIPDYLFEEYVLAAIEGPIDETSISFFIPLTICLASLLLIRKRK